MKAGQSRLTRGCVYLQHVSVSHSLTVCGLTDSVCGLSGCVWPRVSCMLTTGQVNNIAQQRHCCDENLHIAWS